MRSAWEHGGFPKSYLRAYRDRQCAEVAQVIGHKTKRNGRISERGLFMFLHHNTLCANPFRKEVKADGESPVKASVLESSP